MRRHLILFFLALFLLAACKSGKTPGDIIEKNKMARMLADVHIIDGAIAQHVAKDSVYKYGSNRYALMFKKHGVDSALFNKSVKYYAAKPAEMIALYDSVNVILQKKSDSLNTVNSKIMENEMKQLEAKGKAEKKRKADSLKRDSINQLAKPVKLRLKQRLL